MENRKKDRLILAGLFCLCAAGTARAATLDRMRYTMGTLLQIEAEADDPAAAESALEAGFATVARLDLILSNYDANSEISRINRHPFPESIRVSTEMARFLEASQTYSRKTGGAFDVTVEPASRLWHLRERRLMAMPSDEEIGKTAQRIGYRKMILAPEEGKLRFLSDGMGIDTGGIGKGYALDRALEDMRRFPIHSATLNFGGEILYWSEQPQKRWVAVKNPLESDQAWKTLFLTFTSSAAGVSTSANYERFVTLDQDGGQSKKLSHILDPKTGRPMEGSVLSVTVVAPDGTEADALSTAVFVMGLEDGKKFSDRLEREGVLILFQDESGKLQSFESNRWKEMVSQ